MSAPYCNHSHVASTYVDALHHNCDILAVFIGGSLDLTKMRLKGEPRYYDHVVHRYELVGRTKHGVRIYEYLEDVL